MICVIKDMLSDPYPPVRTIAIIGVCRICATFWELIPTDLIKDLLKKIVGDLAWDTSSVEVRVAVSQVCWAYLTFLLLLGASLN